MNGNNKNMADKFPPEFKFNGNEHEPESFYHEELKDLRIEKLSQRVTLLSILLPCLVGVALYFGYRDLSGRLSQRNDSESVAVQQLSRQLENLAKDFNDKLITFTTTLSTQDKDLGNTLEGRFATINNNIKDMQKILEYMGEELKETNTTIERLNASKVDKKSQALEIEKIKAALTPLQAELDKLKAVGRDVKMLSEKIADLDAKLAKQLASAAAAAEQYKAYSGQIQDSLAKLSGRAIDRDALELEAIKLKNYFQSQISKEVSDINQRMESLKEQIDGIGKISNLQKQPLEKISKNAASAQPAASAGSETEAKSPASPSGSIIEKDLIE